MGLGSPEKRGLVSFYYNFNCLSFLFHFILHVILV